MYADNPAIIGIHFGYNQQTNPTITEIKIRLINRGNRFKREQQVCSPLSIRYGELSVRAHKCLRGHYRFGESIDFLA